jgi:dolichol-phosphate mannosyltransferase
LILFFYTILGYAKPGWAETVLISLIGGGIIMIMLGIIGEYLWRTFDETRKRPLYFIEEEINNQ